MHLNSLHKFKSGKNFVLLKATSVSSFNQTGRGLLLTASSYLQVHPMIEVHNGKVQPLRVSISTIAKEFNKRHKSYKLKEW